MTKPMEDTMPSTKTVGDFTLDLESGDITGPARFMRSDDFAAWKRQLKAGDDVVVGSGYSPDLPTAVLVSLQTCYAGWRGREEMFHMLDQVPRSNPFPVTVR